MNDFAIKVLTAPLGQTHIFSVGQAGFIIKSKNGGLLGIDMYLSECVERIEGNAGFKRLLPRLFAPSELEFDAIIATHPHMDHFDTDAIPELMSNGRTKLFASVDCAQYVKGLFMKNDKVLYVRPGERAVWGDFTLDFINCDHGDGAPDAFGVIVTVDGKRICEAGDTCLRTDRSDEYLKKGGLDVFIAPINGAYGNLNEEECAMLADKLSPRLTIPCHYGMFASHGGDPGKFYRIMTEKYPDNKFLIMCMGEKLTLTEE